MKLLIKKIREWLIVKLGGYVEKPMPHVRFDRVDVPIRTVCVESRYMTDCDHSYIRRLVARQLADEICNANLAKYEYFDNPPYDPSEVGLVRASIRVVERREDSPWMT